MLTTLRSMRDFWRYGAVGVACTTLIVGPIHYYELVQYKSQAALAVVKITGTASFGQKSLMIRENDQVLAECFLSKCGYPGIYLVSGKKVVAHFKGSAITRMEIQDQIVDSFALEIQRRTLNLKIYSGVLFAAVAALSIMQIRRQKPPNQSFQRTASGVR